MFGDLSLAQKPTRPPKHRFGLVSTNSITQLFQRRTVARWLSDANPNKRPLSLVFAVDDHPWTKATEDAAAVRIAMTVARAGVWEGERASVTREAKLNTDQPEIEFQVAQGKINPDLTIGVDITRAKQLKANGGLCSRGVSLHGAGFIVNPSEAHQLGLGRADRPGLQDHIRPYLNGRDLTQRSREKMVIDLFGLTSEEVRDRFPEVYQHLSQTVRAARQVVFDHSGTRDAAEYLENWWVFGKPRQELRPALAGLPRFIVTVETSKFRTFQFLDAAVMPDNKLVVIASADAGHFAVLSSRLHETWSLRAGGWLGVGNDPVYVKTLCFDAFPFPTCTPVATIALAEAGERLDAFRRARRDEFPDLTITRLCNALEAYRAGKTPEDGMTEEEATDFHRGSVMVLAELHDEIDGLTLDAYGWPRDLAGEALLGRLLDLNLARAEEEAKGNVAWLRPGFQRARFARSRVAGRQTGDLLGEEVAPGFERAPWPKDARTQVLAIKGALAEAAPLTAQALAARFKGRKSADDVSRLLIVLQRDGQVRRAPDGSYALLRAA